jgi:hypothetical protein
MSREETVKTKKKEVNLNSWYIYKTLTTTTIVVVGIPLLVLQLDYWIEIKRDRYLRGGFTCYLQKVHGFRWYNLQEIWSAGAFSTTSPLLKVKLWINKCMLSSFVALGMRSEGKVQNNGERSVGFSITSMFQHTGRFSQGFLSKEQCDNAGAPPTLYWPGCSWFLHVTLTEINIDAMVICDTNDIIKNSPDELKRISQNGLHEYFQNLESRWQMCIFENGNYFEWNVD